MDSIEKRLPITAFVGSCNEGHLLERCLQGLFFCSEIYIIDLQSDDNTLEVAKRCNTKILQYPRYPLIEEALYHAIPNATQPWVLITDPDEVVSKSLANKVISIFNSHDVNQYAAIRAPIQFYFKDHALKGTIWGGSNTCRFLFQKKDITLSKVVHEGLQISKEKRIFQIERETFDLVVHHYWMTSYKGFIEKVNRYISKEGERMHAKGIVYLFPKQLKSSLVAFWNCFFLTKGYKDGLTGLFLSFIWTYYTFGSWLSLRRYIHKNSI